MKLRQLVTAIGTALGVSVLCVFLAGIVAAVVAHARITYSTPEMQSAFLRTYTLTPVLEHFRSNKYSFSGGEGSGSGAGRGFTTHEREFHHSFVMRASERAALMNALVEGVSLQLKSAGAQIISESGNTREGIQFVYIAGPSTGIIRIEPPSPTIHHQIPRVCPNEVSVSVNIEINEKWTRPAA